MNALLNIFQRLFAILCLGVVVSCSNDSGSVTYHVQLVRGSNDAQPPALDIIAIGPKVAAELRQLFLWTNYWEMARQEVLVASGEMTRVPLSPQREVEIDLTKKGRRTVVAYADGESVTRDTRPIGQRMSIIGGDRDKETAWFIIVRRDEPPQ